MKRIFLLLILAIVGITWLGFARGWFALALSTTTDGKPTIGVSVDQDKINADKDKAKEKAKEYKDKAVDAVKK